LAALILWLSLCNLITHGSRDSMVWKRPQETPMDVLCTTASTVNATQAIRHNDSLNQGPNTGIVRGSNG
jgi:hypothetical protein